MSLSDSTCRTAKARQTPYKLADGGGLYLEVMPHGSKLWRIKYRYSGKERRLALGSYPVVTLAEARDHRAKVKRQLKAGTDPVFAKQEEKRIFLGNAANTFELIAREWHQHNINRWSKNHAGTILRRLEMDIFPSIGKLPIKDISSARMLYTIQAIEKRGAHEIARRALQAAGRVFNYAIVTSRAETNPCLPMKQALQPFKRGHYAALEARDLPEFLSRLYRNDGRLLNQTRMAVELIMLTFVRTSELIKAKWSEFDLEEATWIIPAERMKMRSAHIVPLSRQVIEILKQLKVMNGPREYILPGQVDPRKHMSNNTILFALGRMGYRGKATGHGFRALAMSTIKEKLGYRHEVIDRQLAHGHRDTVTKAYDRAKFLDDRRIMMQEWADYIDSLPINGRLIQAKFKRII